MKLLKKYEGGNMRIIEVEINTKLDGKWYYLAKAKVHFLNMKNLLAHKDYIFVVKERTKKNNLIIVD